MPAPLSLDLRRRILEAPGSAAEIAARFGVSASTVHRLRRLHREHGTLDPKPHGGGHTPRLTDADRPRIEAYLAENPSMPHHAMARRFAADTGRAVSRPTLQRALAGWGHTRKKRP
jgi:transposase